MMDANEEQISTASISPSSDCVSVTAVSPSLDVGILLSDHNRLTAQCEQYAAAFAFLQNSLTQSNAQNQIFVAEIARLNHQLKFTFQQMSQGFIALNDELTRAKEERVGLLKELGDTKAALQKVTEAGAYFKREFERVDSGAAAKERRIAQLQQQVDGHQWQLEDSGVQDSDDASVPAVDQLVECRTQLERLQEKYETEQELNQRLIAEFPVGDHGHPQRWSSITDCGESTTALLQWAKTELKCLRAMQSDMARSLTEQVRSAVEDVARSAAAYMAGMQADLVLSLSEQ